MRWTDDVRRDVRTGVSREELTGIGLPGLSVNSLKVETWWGDRPVALVAPDVLDEVQRKVERLGGDWGTLTPG